MDKFRIHLISYMLILAFISYVQGQFKIVDSSHFRTKKGVNNATAITFVQINKYGHGYRPSVESRGFSSEEIPVPIERIEVPTSSKESSFITVQIIDKKKRSKNNDRDSYKDSHPKNNFHDSIEKISSEEDVSRTAKIQAEAKEINDGLLEQSNLQRIMENNKNRDKFNPHVVLRGRRFMSRLLSNRQKLRDDSNKEIKKSINKENMKILRSHKAKLASKALAKKTLNKYKGFKSNCRCEKLENCSKIQITVPRCPPDYFLCCT